MVKIDKINVKKVIIDAFSFLNLQKITKCCIMNILGLKIKIEKIRLGNYPERKRQDE